MDCSSIEQMKDEVCGLAVGTPVLDRSSDSNHNIELNPDGKLRLE